MVPRRKLWDDAAPNFMEVSLGVDRVRDEPPPAAINGHSGLVTGGFDPQNQEWMGPLGGELRWVLIFFHDIRRLTGSLPDW